nr:MAG TPA: hypothetical protein [Crassvirales sp.]
MNPLHLQGVCFIFLSVASKTSTRTAFTPSA